MHLLVSCNSPNVADIDLTLCRFITLTLCRSTCMPSLHSPVLSSVELEWIRFHGVEE